MSPTNNDNEHVILISNLAFEYQEAEILFGEMDKNSPEGIQEFKEESPTHNLAIRIVSEYNDKTGKNIQLHKTAVELFRTGLGNILFEDVLRRDKKRFPLLKEEYFKELCDFVNGELITEELRNYVRYGLFCNDLGKYLAITKMNLEKYNTEASDHDMSLYKAIKAFPERFPGYQSFSIEMKIVYIESLMMMSIFNLGQMVQGENQEICGVFPVPDEFLLNLYKEYMINKYSTYTDEVYRSERERLFKVSQTLRLIKDFLDFAGCTGPTVGLEKSVTMTDENYLAYSHASKYIRENPNDPIRAYRLYRKYRLELTNYQVDLIPQFVDRIVPPLENASILETMEIEQKQEFITSRFTHVLGSCICLEREFADITPLISAFRTLPWYVLRNIFVELSRTGFNEKSILMYYYPALIANLLVELNKQSNAYATSIVCEDEVKKDNLKRFLIRMNKSHTLYLVMLILSIHYSELRKTLSDGSGFFTYSVLPLANDVKNVKMDIDLLSESKEMIMSSYVENDLNFDTRYGQFTTTFTFDKLGDKFKVLFTRST
jgi:hypothetical protein